MQIIEGLRERYPECNLVICLSKYTPNLEKLFAEKGIPHYYQDFVNTWDKFEGFLSLDVTDIFVVEELAFSALFLSKKAKEKNKALRVFCNVCQSSWRDTPSLKTFFIRPEDINLYASFFDTFEFFYNYEDANEINTFYEIYAKDKKWFGRLDEIIIGYKGEEDSRFFLPDFAEFRIKCQKKCLYSSFCNLCNRIKELSETLKEKDLIVQIDKK